MTSARRRSFALLAVVVLFASCGDESSEGAGGSQAQETARSEATDRPEAATAGPARSPQGTVITLGESEFGPMLFNTEQQAIYIFENDPKGKTVCLDECAEAWPPVLTEGRPKAAKGVRHSLLGTVKRPGGRLQVTYAGKPLYFYAHEGPGEVLCHNVDLNGGLWWVVGADGNRLP